MEQTIRIMGLDPGPVNFSLALVDVRYSRKRVSPTVVSSTMLNNTLFSMENATSRLKRMVREIEKHLLVDGVEVGLIVCERFQSRGLRGLTTETTNVMIGALLIHLSTKYPHIKLRLTTASTWKNKLNKVVDLKGLYKRVRTTPHQLDAVCMSIFAGYKRFNPDTMFKNLESNRQLTILVSGIEKTSKIELRKINAKCAPVSNSPKTTMSKV